MALKSSMTQHEHKARAKSQKRHDGIGEIEGGKHLKHQGEYANHLGHGIRQRTAKRLSKRHGIRDNDKPRKHERIPRNLR